MYEGHNVNSLESHHLNSWFKVFSVIQSSSSTVFAEQLCVLRGAGKAAGTARTGCVRTESKVAGCGREREHQQVLSGEAAVWA